MFQFLSLIVFIYAADIVSTQNDPIDLGKGDTIKLNCNIGSPKWYKLINLDKPQPIHDDGKKYELSNGNRTLTIKNPEKGSDEADFICSTDSRNQTFRVRGKPEFTTFKATDHTKDMNSFNVAEDDDLNLVCEVLLRTAFKEDKINFNWYRKFPNGDEERITRNITSKEELGGSTYVSKKSILSLEDIKYADRAQYICEASNGGLIKANSTVNVRVKDKLAALWPFIGILAEVIFLCTIICIYEKRRGKPEFESDNKSPSKSPAHTK